MMSNIQTVCLLVLGCQAASAQTFTTLFTFNGSDGASPWAPLVQGADGNLYGTTHGHKAPRGFLNGTVFKITPDGALTTLDGLGGNYSFSGLVQASDGNFYGTTYRAGRNQTGSIFRVAPDGTFTTFYKFCSVSGCRDGQNPLAGLIQAKDGNLYGTTEGGGKNG